MMTDRWLDTCLYDSDGRIFLDRDGGVFGDLLKCLRSPDFLKELSVNKERLRRLRSEADYYGLQDSLVRWIDDVTVGKRCVLERRGWARVAGGCLVRDNVNVDVAPVRAGGNNAVGEQNNAEEEVVDDGPNEDGVQAMEDEDDNNEEVDEDEAEEEVGSVSCFHLSHNAYTNRSVSTQLPNPLSSQEQFEFEEDHDDPNHPPPYKRWSWSRQYGNPSILRPHPTHSQMIVGEDGTYLLLLRFAAALPSPLARIRWDQEEEEDRRVTRGAARRNGGRRGLEDSNHDNEEQTERLVEEDYFVTVNIEAPLHTVMDYIDESQTHFPLLRCGLWDYRTEEEVLHEDPVFATVCAMDVVSLRAGDKLTVSYMNDETSRESCPLPDDAPPELVNSLTLIKLCGNTLARYERLKSSPDSQVVPTTMDTVKSDPFPMTPERKGARSRRRSEQKDEANVDEHEGTPLDDFDPEMEEFDRSLTREAHWIEPRNDFQPTPFKPTFSHGK